MPTCKYQRPTDGELCGRVTRDSESQLCYFHSESQKPNDEFVDELLKLDEEGDGNWVGFRFPKHFAIPGPVTFKTEIDLRHARFNGINLKMAEFERSVDARRIWVEQSVLLRAKFCNDIRLDEAVFHESTVLNFIAEQNATFMAVRFNGLALLKGLYKGWTNFEHAEFRDRLVFQIQFQATDSSSDESDAGENLNFQDVFFEDPVKAAFEYTSFERALMLKTNFIGVQLRSISWPVVDGTRYGLFDELRSRNEEGHLYPHHRIPLIEETYRNLRLALEKNREFSLASDFYIGEMSARKSLRKASKHKRNWIEDLYGHLSIYGSSPRRAGESIFCLFFTHLLLTQLVICSTPNTNCLAEFSLTNATTQVTHTLKVMTLQRLVQATDAFSVSRVLLDTVVMILAPILVTLFVLSLRSRIRR